MSELNTSISLTQTYPAKFNALQKTGLTLTGIGILTIFLAWAGAGTTQPLLCLLITIIGLFSGGILYTYGTYGHLPKGIKNNRNFISSISSGGTLAWISAVAITGFYVVLYWRDHWKTVFGTDIFSGLVHMFDPLSQLLRKSDADQWFVYGSFYTIAVLIMGTKFIYKYRHNNYQILRTCSVMFFQLGFAWLIPGIMKALYNFEPFYSYFWPLDYDAIFPGTLSYMLDRPGNLGVFFIFWGIVMSFIATPLLTYFFGKRWYCSWVCGCGGLAETAGDPFRHLSDKSISAWKIERWMIHSVLALIILTTILILVSDVIGEHLKLSINQYVYYAVLIGLAYLVYRGIAKSGSQMRLRPTMIVLGCITGFLILYALIPNLKTGDQVVSFSTAGLAKWYSFSIGMVFSGVIGVGFYPIMGSRVWCRFGCPMAAYMGVIQRFKSRFRITTNGAQCISCGNCSTYCEMGIDVRAYAQRGQNIVRASCVGCGVCSAVCPRGVLKLETGPDNAARTEVLFTSEDLKILV
ncbi:MAG TPA: 4Fe-4S binding protein [Chitinophagales bacterium]|nr:4Fe-4S binding protein [Chitinophagales bacterium]